MKILNIKLAVAAALSVLLVPNAFAAYIYGTETKMTGISVYGRGVVAGDVVITVEDAVTGCEAGYYVAATSAGRDSILSAALSSFHTSSTVIIHGFDAPRWAGSSGNFCEIEGFHVR